MTNEQGAGSVVGEAVLTHGTLESRELGASREFYEKVLGLRCVRHSPVSQLIGGRGTIGVVCVEAAESVHPQGKENRWVLLVASNEELADLHARARASDAVAELDSITETDGASRFLMRDKDHNWWEVASLPEGFYRRVFERGDVHPD